MKLQDASFKNSTEAGGVTNLTDDTKVFVTANGLNASLYDVIANNQLANKPVISVTTKNFYNMASTLSGTTIIHAADGPVTYQLPSIGTTNPRFSLIFLGTLSSDNTAAVVTSANHSIDFFTTTTKVATLTSGTYTHGSSGVAGTLGTEIKTRMDAADGVATYTVTFDSRERIYRLTRSTGTFYFLFGTGANIATSANVLLGFNPADGSALLTQVGYSLFNEMRIIAPGAIIKYNNKEIWLGGHLAIRKRGIMISLVVTGLSTWHVERIVTQEYGKNSNIGESLKDISLIARDVWTAKSTTGITTARSPAAFAVNGYGYICDGLSSSSEVQQFNDYANTWTTKANGGTARGDLTGFALNGYGYICDGTTGSVTNEVNQYSDFGNTWITRATGGTARRTLTSFALNGYGYIANGVSISEVNQYNDSANAWTTKLQCTSGDQGSTGFTLNGYGYVGTSAITSALSQYNDSANTWTLRATDLVTSRYWTASFALNEYGYLCGGLVGGAVSNVTQYNDSVNLWFNRASVGTARYDFSGFNLHGNGYICCGLAGAYVKNVDQYN